MPLRHVAPWFAAALLISAAPVAALAGIEFSPATSYPAGTSPQVVVLGDVDGDGHVDAVVVQSNSILTVLEQMSDGTFVPGDDIPVAGANGAVLVDLDGDGDRDLAVSCTAGLVLLWNDGSGHFTRALNFDSGAGAGWAVAAGDFDQDGDADLALAGSGDSTGTSVRVFRNLGGGHFMAPVSYPLAGFPTGIASGDLDGNGRPDLAVSKPGGFSVLLNGTGTAFQPAMSFTSGDDASSIALGDFDHDGHLDVALAQAYGTFTTWRNLGGGSFAYVGKTPLYGQASSVCAGDFDGDGSADVACAAPDLRNITVRHSHGDCTFDDPTLYFATTQSSRPYALVAGDVNGDGKLDLVTGDRVDAGGGTVTVLLGGRVDKCGRHDFDSGQGASYVTAGDLNGDGVADLAVANENNTLSVLIADGAGGYATAVHYPSGTLTQALAMADLNGDTYPDLVTANYGESSVSLYINRGNGTFTAPQSIQVGSHPRYVVAADLDGDGNVDLVSANYGDAINPGSISVLKGHGDGTFEQHGGYQAGVGPYEISVGQLDANSSPDLVVNDYDGQGISVYLNHGDGTFASQHIYATGWSLSTAIADLDGDGDQDLAVCNFKEGTIGVLLNNGAGAFPSYATFAIGVNPRCIVPTQLDTDGQTDLAVCLSSPSQVVLLTNQGNATFAVTGNCPVGINPKTIEAADVDKNGGLDLLTANTGAGTVSILSDVAPAAQTPNPQRRVPGNRLPPGPNPGIVELHSAYPNPMSDASWLTFSLPRPAHVEMRVYDVAGRTVRTLAREDFDAGAHRVLWDGRLDNGMRAAAGTYFYRMRTGTDVITRSLIVR